MLDIDIQKNFASFNLDISLSVDNEIMVLLAPSGGGKTLTLNALSGMIHPDSGKIKLHDRVLFDSGSNIDLPIRKRNIGYIFQDYALFPHMTVQENIAFGLKDEIEHSKKVEALLRTYQLENRRNEYPATLSGGEKQRAAIARAVASKPQLLLFDEPLSALDVQLKETLLQEIYDLQKQIKVPVIYVTHNFREAEYLGDKIAVLNEGKVVEVGKKNDVFVKPKKIFTAKFLGVKNIFPCSIRKDADKNFTASIFEKFFVTLGKRAELEENNFTHLYIHPKDVRLHVTGEDRPNLFSALVQEMRLLERVYRIHLNVLSPDKRTPVFDLTMDIEELTCKKYSLRLGDTVTVSLRQDRIFFCN